MVLSTDSIAEKYNSILAAALDFLALESAALSTWKLRPWTGHPVLQKGLKLIKEGTDRVAIPLC